MSRRFAESFFPSSTSLLKHFFPETIEHAFPGELDERCPQVSVDVTLWIIPTTVTVRNPVLAVWCVVGMFVGAYGWWVQWRYSQICRRSTIASSSSSSWAGAFAAFAAMNVVALPLHCLVPPAETDLAHAYPILWMLDCVFTGISSIFLVQGSLQLLLFPQQGVFSNPSFQPPIDVCRRIEMTWMKLSRRSLMLTILAGHFLDVSLVEVFTSHPPEPSRVNNIWWKEPMWVEMAYFVPIGLALLACTRVVVRSIFAGFLQLKSSQVERQLTVQYLQRLTVAVTFMLMGLICVVMGPAQANRLCQYTVRAGAFGTHLVDSLSAPTLVFAGCDLSFFGLHLWLQVVQHDERTNLKES